MKDRILTATMVIAIVGCVGYLMYTPKKSGPKQTNINKVAEKTVTQEENTNSPVAENKISDEEIETISKIISKAEAEAGNAVSVENLKDHLTKIKTSTYHEDVIGFTMNVPDGVMIMDDKQTSELDDKGHKLVQSRSKTAQAAEAKGYKSITLFRMTIPAKVQGQAQLIPGITAWQEESPEQLTSKDGPRCLANLRKTMQETAGMSYKKEFLKNKIDGVDIYFQLAVMNVANPNGPSLKGIQEQYISVIDGKILGFAITYNNADEANVLRNILFSTKFDRKP